MLPYARPVVLLVVFAAFLAASGAGLVWDDAPLVLRNATLDTPTWSAVFGKDLWCCVEDTKYSPYYRPLVTVSLLADRYLLGGSTAVAHLQSIAWHLAAVALVGALAAPRLGEGRAAVAMLLFGLHPIQSEAVVWIAARNDLLVTTFVLCAIVAMERQRPVVVGLSAFFACLSKESGFLLPIYVWLWGRTWGESKPVRSWLPLLIALGVALALRLNADLGEQVAGSSRVEFPVPEGGLVVWLGVAARYFAWILVPWPLTGTETLYAGLPEVSTWALAWVAIVLAAIVARTQGRWMLLWWACALAPSFAGIAVYATIGERYLYLPMVGIAFAVAVAIPPGRVSVALVTSWAVAALLAIHARLPDWSDNRTLFTAAASRRPDTYSLAVAGQALAEAKEYRAAMSALDASLAARPHMLLACGYLGEIGGDLLLPDALAARSVDWLEAGCGRVPGFGDEVVMALARGGAWEAVGRVLTADLAEDDTGRVHLVRAAIAEADGDLLGVAALALSSGQAPGAFRARLPPLLAGEVPVAP